MRLECRIDLSVHQVAGKIVQGPRLSTMVQTKAACDAGKPRAVKKVETGIGRRLRYFELNGTK